MPDVSEIMVCLQYAAESQPGLDGFGASGNLDTEGDPAEGVSAAGMDRSSASYCLVSSSLHACIPAYLTVQMPSLSCKKHS